MAKKITNVEVKLINLNANDVIATSVTASINGTIDVVGVGARDYYYEEDF